MTIVVEQRKTPEALRSFSDVPEHDYVDVFTVSVEDAYRWSPAQWARAGLEDAAGPAGQFVWRALLGLRLERSPLRIAGWEIADRGATWIRVEASSWFMTAHIVIQVGEDRVTAGTFVRYDRRVAGFIWRPLSAGHRRAMPGLLRKAVKVQKASA